MSAAPLLAAAAAACGVGAAWELSATGLPAGLAAAARRVSAPLRRPDREPTGAEQRRLVRTGAAVLLGAGWLLGGPWVGLASAAAGPWLIARALRLRRARWRARAAAATPAVARALADALSGGRSVRGAIAEVAAAQAVGPAAGAVLAQAAVALAAGERTEAVLERTRLEVADPRWDTLVAAVLLARDGGGDLVALLRRLAGAGEQARREEEDARTATAQARLTATIVAALPAGALALAALADPSLPAGLLTDPRSAVLVVIALVCQAGSLLAVRRIARVDA